MREKSRSKVLLAAGTAAWVLLDAIAIAKGAPSAAPVRPSFILSSVTFDDGGLAPERMAFKRSAELPDCLGQNVAPQLSWVNPQPGIKSYALTMYELEGGPLHTDLVVYGIPASVTAFAEGELNKASPKFVAGQVGLAGMWNGAAKDYLAGIWHGMCPPANVGTATHHYVFRIRGTDLDPKELPPGLTGVELDAKLQGHTKGSSYITAKFKRPQ